MSTIDIPGYKIVKTLGVGGQATVYLAIQKGFDREVALKVMSPALAADPTFGDRFVREAKIVAKLSHKSIVTVYDVGESGTFYYLAMEYLPGGDLKSKIEKGLKAREALTIISKLARALHFAHEKGYIHRDVKSENILFDSDGEPLLTDFGIAKASNSSTQMTQTGKLIGTPEYMSPEQCRGKTVDARSDLYSLGIIFYEMLTKGVPYTGEDSVAVCIKHVTKPVPNLPVRLKHFQWLIDMLLAKDAAKRFQNGMELSKAIDEFKKSGKQSETVVADTVKVKKKEKPARPFVATDEEIEEFDDLHSEARAFIQEEPKSKVGTFVTIAILLIAGAGGFLTKDKWLPQVEALIASKSEAKQQPQTKSPVIQSENKTDEKLSSSDEPKTKVSESTNTSEPAVPNNESLLKDAEQLTLTKPLSIENIKKALQLIGTVKTLDQNNKDADLVYANILNLSLAEAATKADAKEFVAAEQWLKLVEVESPDHALLDATKQKVTELSQEFNDAQTKEAQEIQRIQLTLAKADKALRENRLSSPPNDNAIALYSEVLSSQPDNEAAKNGLKNVAIAYEGLIDKAIVDKSFARARSMLTRLNAISDNENLKLALKDKIANAEKSHNEAEAEKQRLAAIEKARLKAEKERADKLSDPLVQMKLSSLLDSAKALEAQVSLVKPEGNNALEKYRNILEIDDRNQEAKDGVERIEALILAGLTESIANNQKKEAIEWLTKLELYQSGHPQYESFKNSIDNIVEPIEPDKNSTESVKEEQGSNNDESATIDSSNKNAEGQKEQDSKEGTKDGSESTEGSGTKGESEEDSETEDGSDAQNEEDNSEEPPFN